MFGLSPVALGLVVVVSSLASVSFFFFIMYCNIGKTMETHAIIAIIGYHIVLISAMVWWASVVPTYGNLVLLLIALLFTSVATGMAWVEHGWANTLHFWFGALAYLFSLVIFFSSVYMTFKISRFAKDVFCLLMSVLCLLMSTVALVTGMDTDYVEWAPSKLFIAHIIIIVVYVTLTILRTMIMLFF